MNIAKSGPRRESGGSFDSLLLSDRTSTDFLDDLPEDELKDISNAENKLLEALPKVLKKASSANLQRAFTDHLGQAQVTSYG